MGRSASGRVDYNSLRRVCSAADMALSSSVVDVIGLAIWGVSALADSTAVDSRLDAFEAMLATRNKRINALKSQVASKHTEIAAKTTHLSSVEGRVKMKFSLQTVPKIITPQARHGSV